MRFRTRGPRLALLATLLLLAATMLAGVAEAEEGKGKGKRDGKDREHRDERDDDDDRHGSSHPKDARGDDRAASLSGKASSALGPSLLMLGGLGLGALVLLGLAVLVAVRARRPKRPRVSKKSFEAGRLAAVRARPLGFDDAVAALQDARLGKLVEARWAANDRFVVAVKRRRGRGCDEIAGYLSGLFESAWATDVGVLHSRCGGRARKEPCAFEITRAIGADRRAAAASTRGS